MSSQIFKTLKCIDREAWHAAIHRVAKSRHDWATEMNWTENVLYILNEILYVY